MLISLISTVVVINCAYDDVTPDYCVDVPDYCSCDLFVIIIIIIVVVILIRLK